MSSKNTFDPTPEQAKTLQVAAKVLAYGGLGIAAIVVGLRIRNEGFESVAVDTCLSAVNGAVGCAVVVGGAAAIIAPEGEKASFAIKGAITGAKLGGFWGAIKGATFGHGISISSETE